MGQRAKEITSVTPALIKGERFLALKGGIMKIIGATLIIIKRNC
jgi:hypothetical protein